MSQRLGDMIEITNGFAFKSSLYVDEGVRVVRITNVQKGKVVDDTPRFYPETLGEELSKYQINANDILMALTGNVGRVGLFPQEMLPAFVNQRVCRIKPTSKLLDDKFLFYLLNSDKFEHDAIVNSSGVAQLNLSTKWVENYKIPLPLPSLAEQKKIAAILDTADRLRQKDAQLIAKYNTLSQSLFLDMFGDPVTNPMGWERVSLDTLGKISSGSTPSRSIDEYYQGSIPWVKTAEVNGTEILETLECISDEALSNSSCKLYPAGSLIIAMYGQGKTRGRVGRLGIEATTNQACAVISPSVTMNYDYLFGLLKLSYDDLRQLGRGGNQPNLNCGLIKAYKVISPPITLQNQFAERIQAIEVQKQQAQASLQKSEDLFNSLLQRAFKGELTT